jgi:predicted CoA-binding protein
MVRRADIDEFLAQDHLALVGVSRDPRQFANGVFRALRDHGTTVYPVNPAADVVEGVPCYRRVQDVPDPLGGVLLMVNPETALEVVDDCVERGVTRVWFHKGAGPGAYSEGAATTCRAQGMTVIDDACPLMFLEPVGLIHRVHRWTRRRHLAA